MSHTLPACLEESIGITFIEKVQLVLESINYRQTDRQIDQQLFHIDALHTICIIIHYRSIKLCTCCEI